MTGQILMGLLFSVSVILISFYRPWICRIYLGVIFLFSGILLNIPLIVVKPYYIYQFGITSIFEPYRDLTEKIIGINPILSGVLFIVFEVVTGLMLLGKGGRVKTGLLLSALFLIFLAPVQIFFLLLSPAVPAVLYLIRLDYEKTLPEMIKEKKEGIKTG